MHPKDFQEAQAAIRIFEKHGFIVDSTMPQWIVKYSNGNIYDQFKDSHSMYCAAVGYDEGFNSASISNYVSADEVAEEIGDTFISHVMQSPLAQWQYITKLLEEHGYKIVEEE